MSGLRLLLRCRAEILLASFFFSIHLPVSDLAAFRMNPV
jgi:hypothetical protein